MKNFKESTREIKIEKFNSHPHNTMLLAVTNRKRKMLSIMLMILRQALIMDLINSQQMLKAVQAVLAAYNQSLPKKQEVPSRKRKMILILTLAISNKFIRPQWQILDNHSHRINHHNKSIPTQYQEEAEIFSIYQVQETTAICHHSLRLMLARMLWISLMTWTLEHHRCKQIITLQTSTK